MSDRIVLIIASSNPILEGTDPFSLQQAGGLHSLAMSRRYVENAKIANAGVKLD